MKNKKLRKEIQDIINQQNENKEKLEVLAYKLWESEEFSSTSAKSLGYKRVLRMLGFVI